MARPKRSDGKNAQTVASNKYQSANYDRINILAPKNYKQTVKQAADACSMNLSQYIITAINEKIEREKQ